MAIDFRDERAPGILDMALYLVGVAGLAASITVLFLGMRAVMDIGGYCAEGGPYVIDRPCPDGVALAVPLSIFGGLASAALVAWRGSRLGGHWAAVVLLAWPALFISLGWNFLEYAFFPPQPQSGIVWGWLIPGVLFVIMGGVPLLVLLPRRGQSSASRRQPVGRYDGLAEGEARYANELRRGRRRLLSGLVQRANQRTSQRATPNEATLTTDVRPGVGPDLVTELERLAALHRGGSLTYDEFQRAKAALIGSHGGE